MRPTSFRSVAAAATLAAAILAAISLAPGGVSAARADLVVVEEGPVKRGAALDLGELRLSRQTRVTAEFSLKNTGGSALVVSRFDLPCGCLDAQVDGAGAAGEGAVARLAPGQTARVRLGVDLLQVPAGPFVKTVGVYEKGREDAPAARLTVTGRVVPAVRFDPPAASVGRWEPGKPWGARVVVAVDEDLTTVETFPEVAAEPADVLRAAPAGAPERDAASRTVRRAFDVSLVPGAPFGPVEARLKVKSASPVVAGSAFLFVGTLAGPVTARPSLAMLGAVEAGGGPAAQSVTLTGEAPEALRGLTVGTSSPHLTATLGEPGGGASGPRVLTFSVGADAPSGPLKETVTVRLADGRRLLVPVSARVRRTAPASAASGLVGRTIPAFTLPDVSGASHTVRGATGGRPAALFFFCGCGACYETAAEWAKLQRGGVLDGVDTVIVYHEVSAEGIRAMAAQTGLDPAKTLLLRDEANPGVAAARFDAPKCPRVFVLGPDGIVRYTNAGRDDDPEAQGAPAIIAARALEATAPSKPAPRRP